MNSQQSLSPEDIVPLFVTTYQGASTGEINDAYNYLLEICKENLIPFIKACQKILENKASSHHLCQSVSTFLKYVSKYIVDNRYICSNGSKDFINKIENIFDNEKVPLAYKETIALSYIKAAFHFQVNMEKVVGRITYLYNTKETQKALLLSRAFLASESRLDAKTQNFYYQSVLKLEVKNLEIQISALKSQIQQGNDSNLEVAQDRIQTIQDLLKNIHSALCFIAFEKFESSIFKCLESKEIVKIIDSLEIFHSFPAILILLREIIQKILQSLYRMRRIYKYPNLIETISKNIHAEWNSFQESLQNKNSLVFRGSNAAQNFELQVEISKIKLITAGLNSKIILILDDSFDIANVLVTPLFEIRTQIFQKNLHDTKETLMFFEDTCFLMKSECLEVQFNRFVKALLTNYEVISSKLYLILDEILFSNKEFIRFLAENQNAVVLLLSFLAFQTSYFMTNIEFMAKLDEFLSKFEDLIFNSENVEVYFHSLLLIFNYLEDIFCKEMKTPIFEIITKNFIERRLKIQESSENDLLIAQFEQKVLKNFYQRKYSDQKVQKEYLSTTFDPEAVSIFLDVLRNYNIEDKFTLEIFDKMFESIASILNNNQTVIEDSHIKIKIFTKFLEVFFDSDIYKHLFESILARVLPFFEIMISQADLFMDQFFNIVKNAVKHMEYVPESYFCWISNLFTPEKLQTKESFYSLISVLKYAKPSTESKSNRYEIFVNFTALTLIQTIYESIQARSLTDQPIDTTKLYLQIQNSKEFFARSTKNEFQKTQFMSLLTLHQLVYYHSGYLTRKTLEKIIYFAATRMELPETNQPNAEPVYMRASEFSFVQGKYQLLFVILFRRRLPDVNQILCKMRIEESLYNAIYIRDFHYLIEYDTPILIKEQAEILKNSMARDKLQMACANTSFLVIFYKFTVLYETKLKKKRLTCESFDMESSDSDEEEFELKTEFKTNFKEAVSIINQLDLPQEWAQINELKEIKEFVQLLRSTEAGREWLGILMKNCLTKEQIKIMEDLMKDLEIVNGSYRHIKKINKNMPFSENHQNSI